MKIVFAIVLTISICAMALGQAKNETSTIVPDDELIVRELANKWLTADAKGDPSTVNVLLADEFSFLNGNNKTQYLAQMNPDPTLIVDAAIVEDQKVQIYGETAIVTGINSYRFKKEGRPVIAKFPSLTVWVKRSGRWQCVKAATLPALTY